MKVDFVLTIGKEGFVIEATTREEIYILKTFIEKFKTFVIANYGGSESIYSIFIKGKH